jgi:hypothetical protein
VEAGAIPRKRARRLSMAKTRKPETRKTTKKSAKEIGYVATKAALAAVPVVGGSLAEIFAYLITEPVAARRDAWVNEIAERLQELEKRLNEPLIERLKNDEGFTTVLLNATQIAIRNHQQEKLQALRNAVLNAGLGQLPDDIERAIMLSLIDQLTPAHLAVLALMRAPGKNDQVAKRFASVSLGGLTRVIQTGVPVLAGRDQLVAVIWRNLFDAGLMEAVNLNVTMSGSGLMEKRTSQLGDRFLDFISDPLAQ